ncbi:MAG: carboxypeptidase-like regulatory domain-containing protein [Terracidiphilus sp.]
MLCRPPPNSIQAHLAPGDRRDRRRHPSQLHNYYQYRDGIQTTATTDENGNFAASGLPFGHYVVSASAANFGKATTQPFVLNVGATVRINLTLAVAAANESVKVTGTTTTVDATSSTAGTTLDSVQVSNLPVNGRDVSVFDIC